MKTKDEMINRYDYLYNKMVESKDPSKMKILGGITTWTFKELADKHQELADTFISHMEAICWNNYLSEREMMNISKRTINQDESRGFHWSYDVLTKALKELGAKDEEVPFFNCYALATVMNVLYSDHAMSVAMDLGYENPKEVPNGKIATSFYRKAIEKLKDVDNPCFVREYFAYKMYDNSPMPK